MSARDRTTRRAPPRRRLGGRRHARRAPSSRDLLRSALGSVFAAAFLVTLKLVAGLLSGSLGLVAEAVHSGTDLVAALLTFLALRVAIRPPDRDHPYGHGKAEHLAALGEGAFLVLASAFIGVQALDAAVRGRRARGRRQRLDLRACSAIVLVVDISRLLISHRAAVRHSSPALASNALHFASDMVGTVAVLIGLVLRGRRDAGGRRDRRARRRGAGRRRGGPADAPQRRRADGRDAGGGRERRARRDPRRRARRRAAPPARARRGRAQLRRGDDRACPPDAALGEGHAVADSIEDAVQPRAAGQRRRRPRRAGRGGAGDLRERASAAALTVRGVREVHNVRRRRRRRPPGAVAAPQAAGRPRPRRTRTTSPARSRRRSAPRSRRSSTSTPTSSRCSTEAEGARPQPTEVAAEERVVRGPGPRADRRASRTRCASGPATTGSSSCSPSGWRARRRSTRPTTSPPSWSGGSASRRRRSTR